MTREYPNAIGEFRDVDEANLWTDVVVKCVKAADDPAGAIEYADDIIRAYRARFGGEP